MTLARYESVFVARSLGARNANSAGVSSTNVVVAPPDLNVGWSMRFRRNAMLVLTPRILNSRSARLPLVAASSSVEPHVVTLTSSESKYGVMTEPPNPLPPSRRTAKPPADR